MSGLTLTLFGSPSLEEDGAGIGLPSRKALALLAYLAVTGAPHRRATLAAMLWPESDRKRAQNVLRYTLSLLRRALGGRWLAADRETVGLDGGQEENVDVLWFHTLLAQCRTHGHGVRETCPECLSLLGETVELYRGDFLAGFSLRDSVEFDMWQSLEAEALRQELVGALERLVEGLAAQGEVERAGGYAKRWLALEPLDEAAHRALMRLYAGSGQQAAALRQYETCERVLAEELGVSPGPETMELYQAIKERRLPQLQVAPQPPIEVPSAPRHNLPTSLTPFVGRRSLLAEIGERLQDPSCRLLSLVGPGGSGKTRLALEAAAQEIGDYREGVFFVSLAPLQSVDAIVPTVAQVLSFPLSTDADRDPRQQLLDYLRGKRMLLILDNFEHLLEGAGLVVEVLSTAPEVKIVATSRARLNVQGEYLLPVPGMDAPPLEAEAPLSEYDAVELFLRSARRGRPDFDPTAEELIDVGAICRVVGGMPLAILLAASWTAMLDPGEIVGEMSLEGLDFLETDWRGVPERQRSMRAVLDHSWHLLSEREQEVLAALSVFRGGFVQQAARQVTGASMRELRTLVERSLVQRTPSGRYGMHELLRQYGAEQLALSPAAEASAHDRHSAYYAAALQRWAADLRGPRQAEAMAGMMAEVGNARAAWEWAVERGNVARVGQAMDGLCRFYEWRGRLQEGEAACGQVAERLSSVERDLTLAGLRALVRARGWQGRFNQLMGHNEVSRRLLQKGLALLEEPRLAEEDSRSVRAFLLHQLGQTVRQSDREEARQLWEESLALHQTLGDQWAEAALSGALGHLYWDVGERDRGRRVWEETLGLHRSLGDPRGIAEVLRLMAMDAGESGQLEASERLAQEAIDLLTAIGDRLGTVSALGQLSNSFVRQGRFAEAHRLKEEIAAETHDLGSRESAGANLTLAWVKTKLGLYEEARALTEIALGRFREMDDRQGIGYCGLGLGVVALVQEAYEEAEQLLRDTVAILREVQQPSVCAEVLVTLGHAELGLGRPAEAERCLHEGMQMAAEVGHSASLSFSLCLMSVLLADRGEIERAVELYALARLNPQVANSRYREDIAGRHIATLAATLPPEVVAAAQERGRARDLEATVAELLMELERDQITEDPP